MKHTVPNRCGLDVLLLRYEKKTTKTNLFGFGLTCLLCGILDSKMFWSPFSNKFIQRRQISGIRLPSKNTFCLNTLKQWLNFDNSTVL